MTETNLNLEKVVFDGNNSERNSWTCVGQTCSRSLIVFLSQFFIILLIILGSFWRIHLATSCEESTVLEVYVALQESLFQRRDYEQVNFHQKACLCVHGWT